jgi:hypothetical protein
MVEESDSDGQEIHGYLKNLKLKRKIDSDYLDSGRDCNLETATEPLQANEPFIFPSCSNLSVKIARKIH